MKSSKKIISLLMCMLMVLTMVPMSVFATVPPIEIDTVQIEGVLAPQYGDTVKDHFDDMIKKGDDGEFKVNGLGYYVCDLFDEMEFSLLDKDKKMLDKSEVIVEGIYYFAMTLYPAVGYVIPDDAAVTVDGAVSVEKDFDEYGALTVYAKYEVEAPAPTEIGTVQIEGIPVPLYGQTVKEYNTVMYNGSMDGTHKINSSTRVDNSGHINYGNIELSDWEYYNSEKSYIAPSSADALPSVYYLVHWLNPAAGYKFPNDVDVTVDGAVSVETELDEDGCLAVWAKFEVAPPTVIDTINIEGVLAPLYGQTIKSYYEAIEAKITDGTITVNDEVYDSTAYKYGNLLDDGWNVRSEADAYLSSTSTDLIKEGTYYVAMWFLPDNGYVIPEDVNVLFDGAKSVKIEVEDDGCLDIRAEFEVKAPAPTVIDTINIEGVPAPLYGQTPKDYLDDVIAKVKVNNELYDSKNQAFGNLNVEWQAIYDSTKTKSLLSSSEIFSEGTYYYMLELYPKTGFVFADIDDISASVNGNASVELEASTVYDDTVLVWVKLEVAPPTEIDTINIEGVPAPVYGQTSKDYLDDVIAKVKVNNEPYDSKNQAFGNLNVEWQAIYDSTKTRLSSSEIFSEGTYYYLLELYPKTGFVFADIDDISASVNGNASVELEASTVYDDTVLVWVKLEVAPPTEIDTVHIEGVPAPVYGQTVEEYYTAILDERGGGTLTVNDEAFDKTKGKYGNLFDEGLDVKKNDTVISSTSTELITEGNYYVAMTLYPADGYAIPTDVAVTVDGAVSVEKDFDEYGSLIVYAKYEVKATKIDTIHIEGVLAPQYGQTVEDHFDDMIKKGDDGEFKVNGLGYYVCDLFDDMGFSLLDKDKKRLDKSEVIVEGIYYFAMTLYPAVGYVIPDDAAVTVDGAASVETELDEDGWLAVWAKFEVAAPTEIDTVHIEGVPAPVYGQTIKSYYEAIEAKITDGTITVNDEVYDTTAYKYGNLLDDGWNVRTEADGYLSSTSTDLIKEGTYYVAMWFLPDNGYVIPEDVNVLFDGAKSVKIEVESDGCLDIRAEYEVKCPHAYDNDCDAECNLCTEIRTAPHTYDNACDAECNNCPATRTPAVHKGGTATCTDKAKCSVCGEAYGSVNKNNHKSITTLKAVSATYKATGLTEGKKCTACGTVTVPQKTVAKKVLGKVTGLKTETVKLASGTKTTLTLAWTKVADAQKYEVYQQSGKKWKKIGTTSKTTLTVKKLKSNKSYKFKVRAIRSDAQGAYSTVFTGKTVPLTPAVTLKAGKKQLTASWKTVANITGYEVQASTSKKFTSKTTKKVTIKKVKTTKTTIKKLTKGKKYYVKVRAYKTVGSKKVYSAWSAVKSVKVK